MFIVVKLAHLTVSCVLLINGFVLLALVLFILYQNRSVTELFTTLEILCKSTSDEFAGTDITSVFLRIMIQAYIALPLAVFTIIAGGVSVMGAVIFNERLLKVGVAFWIVCAVFLSLFFLYLTVSNINIDDSYMYCYLSVLTDLLQRGVNSTQKTMALIGNNERYTSCCGVRGPGDYAFYSEMFGSDHYPSSCCYDHESQSEEICREQSILEKQGCFSALKLTFYYRRNLYVYVMSMITFLLLPVFVTSFWLRILIGRREHLDADDSDSSSDESSETEIGR